SRHVMVVIEGKFDSAIFDVPRVDKGRSANPDCCCRLRYWIQHALCGRIEPFDGSVNFIVPQGVIQAYVHRTSFLPFYTPVVIIAGPKPTAKLASGDGVRGVVNA